MNKTIFCPRTKSWEKFFQLELEKLLKTHHPIVLTEVNIEQIKNFNCLPLRSDSQFTGVILQNNHIYCCSPYAGNEKTFKKDYPNGLIFKKKKWWFF